MPENQCFRPLPHSSSIMHLTIVMWNKFRTIELLWGNGWIPWFPGVILAWAAVQLHGMHNDQNLTLVDFYMKSLRELAEHRNSSPKHSDEIKRIFSPRVNVIGIRKCVRACIRRRKDHFEQNFAN
ncbi:hypothetical protein SFRURICE_002596 [Spodoptera frugiperda]|nr:hypothetical protein SFRURICE_002596 [Spodoptera frugiperda]